ncbi:MAG TPA: AAA domain-containing protein [Hyphomicrobiaceae bacterium]|nr:AAA domain-containing protein [Hyphomicrobiaceae bacterium]
MTLYVRVCPACSTERPLQEDDCQKVLPSGELCSFPLLDIHPTPAGDAPAAPVEPADAAEPQAREGTEATGRTAGEIEGPGGSCPNGHPVEPDDLLCPTCGVRIGNIQERDGPAHPGRTIADWQIVAELPHAAPDAELFLVRRDGGEEVRVLRHYRTGLEPDPSLYSVIETLGRPDVAALVAHGRFEGRAFEVWEHVEGQTLGELRQELAGQAAERVAVALIRTLAAFEQRGLRHGNLQPSVIRLRSADPLVLCVTDFASARIAEFDVEASRFRQTSRYMAPEAVAEASTVASDWWSLGIVLLEMLTDGHCFEGVHERAFLLHLVARGITLPDDLTPRWRNLLEGLLTRNHEDRWRAEQALRWADGESDIPTKRERAAAAAAGPSIHFAGRTFTAPAELAFAAAEEENWAEALAALNGGRIVSWLASFKKPPPALETVRKIAGDQPLKAVDKDFPLALVIATLNPDLPLCIRGELVTPTALLAAPETGRKWLSRDSIAHLRRLKRPSDHWLILLADRAQRVRSRAKDARIGLDEDGFAMLQLATSSAALEQRWAGKRALFPDSDNPVLASLIDRRTLTDEDLLLLAAASIGNFLPAQSVLLDAERLAGEAGVTEFDRQGAARELIRPRRELADELAARVPGFERCGRASIDGWMDVYRATNRRMPLARMLVVLAIPTSDWAEPAHQDYVRNVVSFLERRILAGIQRGPLVQMRATKSVLDLTELRGADLQARILNAIVTRADEAVEPRVSTSGTLVDRLRDIESKARMYQRDTGLDALYLAFPILTLRTRNDDGEKTRIAPVLLWPIALGVQRGATGSLSFSFDQAREVQLNPALESILGPETAARWQDWASERLREGFESHVAVLRAAAELVEDDVGEKLVPVPKASAVKPANRLAVHPSAAIFLVEFASQAIASDLRQLQQKPLEGTALECLLRLRRPEAPSENGRIKHLDRFATLEADPSQEAAVFRSRHAPGIVVQGPPGTGKSQTIVNIVTDCIGRNETVLVVCEKKAALDVVQKRLAAEQLGHRLFRIESTQSDRATVLRDLQAQVPLVLDARTVSGADGQAKRRQIAAQLDALETDLDAYHEAVYLTDERLGLTYREVLSLVAEHDARSGGRSAPGLRALLGPLGAAELESVIGECAGLADVWLKGGVSAAALEVLRPLATDAALAARIGNDLAELRKADETRTIAFAERSRLPADLASIVCLDADALGRWLEENRPALEAVPADVLERAARWRFFAPAGRLFEEAEAGRKRLAELIDRLDRLAMPGPASLVHAAVRDWTPEEIAALAKALPSLRKVPGPLDFLNPARLLRLRAARSVLCGRGVATDRGACLAHAEAALFETSVRAALRELKEIGAVFAENLLCPPDRGEVLALARALARGFDVFRDLADRLQAAPVTDLWPHMERLAGQAGAIRQGVNKPPLSTLLTALGFARAVAAANALTLREAERLAPYLTEDALDGIRRAVAIEAALPLDWGAVQDALPALVPYQTFRLRQAHLSPAAHAAFPELAPLAGTFRADGSADAGDNPAGAIAALMRREAAMAWKAEIEVRHPRLQRIATEIETDIAKLEALDGEMRDVNRRVLAHIDASSIRGAQDWSRIWAIGGVNSQRLRQVFDRGRQLGLLRMRPVWLVNPDVASRMLPLEPGLFDTVVFDEASQMRVDSALPALYRAKRVVVSGDEKQLPPTSFFGTRIQADPADDDDGDDDPWGELDADPADDGADAEAGASSIDPRELAASERHIKDCEDLLTLATGLLPSASLDIHYRSAYRELIDFSNAAYYGGKLNIPVRRPPGDVIRARPIEVRRVDGIYLNQTNPDEAAAIVDLLAELWGSKAPPPTIGVVTFNMKQAELIEARLRQRADESRKFARALDRERTRKAEEEDVGFFVKNLENVQGDERDWIVFSTTFGRDEAGVFKRVFGALNQQGGERRLNVAVTRAKQKVVLVTSMPTAEISSFIGQRRAPTLARDYLQGYMTYAQLVHDGDLDAAAGILGAFGSTSAGPGAPPASQPDPLVLQVLDALLREGYDATIMPPGDAFSIDIAVTDPDTGLYALGVEIDSPRHRLLARARAREVWRRKLLARSGLRLHRIQSSAWAQDRTAERERLIHAARAATAGANAP